MRNLQENAKSSKKRLHIVNCSYIVCVQVTDFPFVHFSCAPLEHRLKRIGKNLRVYLPEGKVFNYSKSHLSFAGFKGLYKVFR